MAALEEYGVADHTLLIFTSDNGPDQYMFSRREQYGHDSSSHFLGAKGDNWEGGHRVPFVARWPGRIEPGTRSDVAFGLVDLMATIAEIVGVELPNDVGEDSVSILPLLEGRTDGYPADRSLIHHSLKAKYGIRQGDWKLLLHSGSGGIEYEEPRYAGTVEARSVATGERQLYNLAADPAETTNLAEKHPEIVQRLTLLAADHLKRGRSRPGTPEPFVRANWPPLDWLPAGGE
jgi:arylsulfatase A